MSVIAVVVGGGPVNRPDLDIAEIVAADSGLDRAREAGLEPDVLIGDLDSISDEGTRWAQEHGLRIEQHLADKDDTDTTLALRYAAASGHRHLLVLGSSTVDRLDHQLGTLVALGAPEMAAFESITALLGETELHVLHAGHPVDLDLHTGATFSLLALHGPCEAVDVTGARWPLSNAQLLPGRTLGISNESTGARVHVAVGRGVLTVVVPPSSATGVVA